MVGNHTLQKIRLYWLRNNLKTQTIKYSEVQPNDQIFTNGKDNHALRKLGFQEIEIVESVKKYESRGAGLLCLIVYKSGNSTLGFPSRELEKAV